LIADLLALLGEALVVEAAWNNTDRSQGAASPKRVRPEQGIEVVDSVAISRRHKAPVDVEHRPGADVNGAGWKVRAR
jgi:hypothetical protein